METIEQLLDKDYNSDRIRAWKSGTSVNKRIIAQSLHIIPYDNDRYIMTIIDEVTKYSYVVEIARIERLWRAYHQNIEYEIIIETPMIYTAERRVVRPATLVIAVNRHTKIHFYSENTANNDDFGG